MKNIVFGIIIFFSLFYTDINAQIVNDPNLQLDTVLNVQPFAVRVAFNQIDSSLFYCTTTGDIYKVLAKGNIPPDSLIATVNDHSINHLTGMAFYDSTLYLSGTIEIPNAAGYGLIIKSKLNVSGTRSWDTLMITSTYQNLGQTFDHSFGGLCLTPDGDSIFVASGSRTDHGEVQDGGGLFPSTREVPLTSLILKLPTNTSNIFIPNDSAWIDASGFLFNRGVRNTFDIAYAPDGEIFGSENSGDRDDPDELNWLVYGGNYGFPWKMGNNQTGQQFAGYDYTQDLLLNPKVHSVTLGLFHDDPSYPPIPSGTIFRDPVRNYGPDADIFRDPLTGYPVDANAVLTYTSSFTPHRSPLGLVFDTAGALGGSYYKKGFVLSYTEGTNDSSSFVTGNGLGPFRDLSEDLLLLNLTYNSSFDNYIMNCTKLVEQLTSPVDAVLVGNTLYILEISFSGNPAPRLMALHFPANTGITENSISNSITLYPNPAQEKFSVQFHSEKAENCSLVISDICGREISKENFNAQQGINKIDFTTSKIVSGIYLITLITKSEIITKKIIRR